MDPDTKAYFDQVVRFNVGDVKELLKWTESGCAGPLLTMVANGIDIFGGMCDGFRIGNSHSRSVNFMINEMGFSSSLAKLMFVCVRCGMNHEGMTKAGFRFSVDPKLQRSGRIIRLDGENKLISLYVVEFAHAYLNAVDRIIDQPNMIAHHPSITDSDRNLFLEAVTDPENDGLDFVEIWSKSEDGEQDESKFGTSSSPEETGEWL